MRARSCSAAQYLMGMLNSTFKPGLKAPRFGGGAQPFLAHAA